MAEIVYIGLGSNLGDRERFLDEAVMRIKAVDGLEITAVSAIYSTRPHDMPEDSPPFLNQVVKAEYQYPPGELLHMLEKIERDLGRTEKGQKQPRTIDLDILLFGDQQVETDNLTIPHPRLLHRAFVLIPLLQIDSDIVHPASGKPLSDFVTTGGRATVKLHRDHVARQV